MGWAMAVLVEMVMLPFESVKVMGTGMATGVVGRFVASAGGVVMTMLLDAGLGEVETLGAISLAGGWIRGAKSIGPSG